MSRLRKWYGHLTRFKQVKGTSLSNFWHAIAFWGGSGYNVKMPGTMGTIAAIPLHLIMVSYLTPVWYIVTTALLALFGIWICAVADEDIQDHGGRPDSVTIVFDEVVGLLVTMSFFFLVDESQSWEDELWRTFLGVIAFRYFDIKKPSFIGFLDKSQHGGLGIMIDDVAAAIAAGLASVGAYILLMLLLLVVVYMM